MALLRVLIGTYAISLQRQLAHRTDLVFEGLQHLTIAGAGAAALGVVFAHVPALAGWSLGEALVLLGLYQVVSGLREALVEPSLAFFSGRVHRGELDDLLLQPVPSLVAASLGALRPWALIQAAVGVAIAAAGLQRIGGDLTPAGLVSCLVLLLAGLVVTWSSRVVLASLAFWAPGFEPSLLYFGFWELGRYPIDVYYPALRLLLTYVVPMAFIATLPARALMRASDPLLLLQGLAGAIGSVWIAHLVWQAGLRRYRSATS